MRSRVSALAAMLIAAVIGLLWVPAADALADAPAQPAVGLRRALLLPGRSRRSIVPPLLDAEESLRVLGAGARH